MRSMEEVYGSLAYDGALLLRVPLCVSRAFLGTLCLLLSLTVTLSLHLNLGLKLTYLILHTAN